MRLKAILACVSHVSIPSVITVRFSKNNWLIFQWRMMKIEQGKETQLRIQQQPLLKRVLLRHYSCFLVFCFQALYKKCRLLLRKLNEKAGTGILKLNHSTFGTSWLFRVATTTATNRTRQKLFLEKTKCRTVWKAVENNPVRLSPSEKFIFWVLPLNLTYTAVLIWKNALQVQRNFLLAHCVVKCLALMAAMMIQLETTNQMQKKSISLTYQVKAKYAIQENRLTICILGAVEPKKMGGAYNPP